MIEGSYIEPLLCDQIVQGRASGLLDLARLHGLTHRYVKSIFPLAFLSPESFELLLNDRDDRPRTLESLTGKVPVRWDLQKASLRPGDMTRRSDSLTQCGPDGAGFLRLVSENGFARRHFVEQQFS